jgi:hypothetical protein
MILVLEVVYTENEMAHRFIRFTINEDDLDSFRIKLDEYIKDIHSFEAGIQFYKLNADTDIIEEVNGFGKLMSPTNKKNCRAFTLMFICDLHKNNIDNRVTNKRTTSSLQVINTAVGEMHIYKESDLKRDEYQRILSHWMLVFTERFSDVLDSMKFFELRPNSFV